MDTDTICFCGHDQIHHDEDGCEMLYYNSRYDDFDSCGCEGFKMDNLKYLEAVALRNGY